ncbi:MAG: methyltransferase domain-containing protein [Verrucomicrobiales bacterium]|nr:methyltransferase domain-containing protein [Verrucomicrobiales bacterium]
MDPHFLKLKQVWETLGDEDPLWAVVSRPDKRGGRWDLQEFLATGVADVERFRLLLQRTAGAPDRFQHVLDFGCGVGRLSLAWSQHAERVTGVDISEPMVTQARRIAEGRSGMTYVVNPRPDLSVFADASFDLCFSHICLQHMPWDLARGYLREFARVCAPGGWIAFQLPSAPAPGSGAASLRQRLVDGLPFGLDRWYRRLRHGSSTVFEVFYTQPEVVLDTLRAAGAEPLLQEPDDSAGHGTSGFLYAFRKPARA